MSKLSHFATNRSGAVAVMFSLAALPAIALIGAGIDFGRMMGERAAMQAAADAAALAAGLDMTNASDSTLQTGADRMVRTALAHQRGLTVRNVGVQTVDNQVVLRVNASASTMFGKVLGMSSVDLSTVAAVPKRVGRKQDLYFLLDSSASMGLAATTQGRDKLIGLVGCAFACHDPEGGQTKSNLTVAQENGVQTRVDVLRDAVGGMIDRMISRKTALDTFRVAIDTFDDAPHRSVPLTSDLSGAKSFLTNYQLGYNTSFTSAMPTYNFDVGSQGDGVSTPEKFAIIVSDGVQGRRDRVGGFRPFDVALCNMIKGQRVTLIVLNTKYILMPTQQAYRETVQPIQSQLEPALQACASPGWYFSATDKTEIEAAFHAIDSAIHSAKLHLSK